MGKTNSTIALLVSSVSPVDAVRATHPMVSTPSKIAKLLVFWDGASRVAWIAVPPRSQRQRLTAARDSHPPVLNHASSRQVVALLMIRPSSQIQPQLVRPAASVACKPLV